MIQYSSIVDLIIKNHLIRSSYTSHNPKKDLFTYKDEVSGREMFCGLINLWLCLNVVRPQLVVNYWVHKTKLKDFTLLSCNNNVNTFLTTMEKIRTVINSILRDKQESAEHRFVTIMFDQLLKSSCEDFLTNVKQAKNDWIKNPRKFDCASAIIDFTNLYTNFTSTGHWYKLDANADTIIALETDLKKERDKNTPKVPKTQGTPGDGRPGLETWKFDNVGKFKTVGGVKHVICEEHGRKDEKENGGMYIPFPHEHLEYLAAKQKKQYDWKRNKKKSKANGKLKAPDANPSSEADPTKLSISKTFKSDLTSKVHLYDQEADLFVNEAEKAVAVGSLIKFRSGVHW